MDLLKKLLHYAPEKKLYFYLSMIFSAIATVLIVLPYYYIYIVLKSLIIDKNVTDAQKYAIIVVIIMAIRVLIYLLSLMCSHLFAFRIESNMKKLGIDNLLASSFSFLDTHLSGVIRKTIDDNTVNTHTIVAHILPDSVNAMLLPILIIATMFFIDIRLGIFIIISVVIAFICMFFMFGKAEFQKKYMEAIDTLNGETVEYVRCIQVIKIFNAQVTSFKKLYECIVGYAKLALDYTYLCRLPYVVFEVYFMMFTAICIPFYMRVAGINQSVETVLLNILFFSSFAGLLFNSFMKVMMVGQDFNIAKNTIQSIESLFAKMTDKKLKSGNVNVMKNYDIEFKNVTFSYEKDIKILDNLSFKLEQNKTYALIGSSGGGKSSIAKLISGFYSIDSGQILIGDEDITNYDSETLTKNIAFVFQNTKLFKKTIFENVKIGNENASYEDVMRALSLAKCDDILDKFPQRENTLIGAKGVHLSGGQIQRISIARAILKNANIIILDEASAATDPENEYEIQQAFTNLMKNKTVIMIAHRLSTIKNVDEILVIDDGKVIERGTDKELMSKNTRYKKLQDMFTQANDWRVEV